MKFDSEIDDFLKQSQEIARKIQALTGLIMFGLDTLPAEDGTLHVLEINPFFGFKGAEKTLNKQKSRENVAKKIINYLKMISV